MTKKKLKKEIYRLENELYIRKTTIDRLIGERDEWRKKCELALNTPEVKADTEAAFQRGASYKYSQMRSYLVMEMTRLIDGLSSTPPLPGSEPDNPQV